MNKQSGNIPIVYVYNLLEDIVDTFRSLQGHQKEDFQKEHTTFYNQSQIFSILSEFPDRNQYYFVFYVKINKDYIQYVKKLLGAENKKIEILNPKKNLNASGSISEYVLNDQNLLLKLRGLQKFDLLSYAITDQFLKLCKTFEGQANCLEVPVGDNWQKIKRYGTKPGIRELAESMNDPRVIMPVGKIFQNSESSFQDAIQYLTQKLYNGSAVAKTQKGCSGFGVLIIKHKQVQSLSGPQIKSFLIQKMSEPYWKKLGIVVQDLINIDFSTGTPCIQFKFNEKGEVEVVQIFTMCTSNQCELDGIQNGGNILKKQIIDRLKQIATILGNVYYGLGYRGYINVDCHISKEGIIYLAQSNVRRSGALYMHNLAKYLKGSEYNKDYYLKTHYFQCQKAATLDFKTFIKEIQARQLNYTKAKGTGLIITTNNIFKSNWIQFLSITKTREEGIHLARKLIQMFE